jgi:hypothetical protein
MTNGHAEGFGGAGRIGLIVRGKRVVWGVAVGVNCKEGARGRCGGLVRGYARLSGVVGWPGGEVGGSWASGRPTVPLDSRWTVRVLPFPRSRVADGRRWKRARGSAGLRSRPARSPVAMRAAFIPRPPGDRPALAMTVVPCFSTLASSTGPARRWGSCRACCIPCGCAWRRRRSPIASSAGASGGGRAPPEVRACGLAYGHAIGFVPLGSAIPVVPRPVDAG